jgi:hypothetical protein
MKIKLKDGKEIELTEEVIQKVADLIIDSGDLEKPDYPYVGVIGDEAVLFTSKYKGIPLYMRYPSDGWDTLEITDGWIIEEFIPLTGCIHYKNGKPVKTEVE